MHPRCWSCGSENRVRRIKDKWGCAKCFPHPPLVPTIHPDLILSKPLTAAEKRERDEYYRDFEAQHKKENG